MNASPSAHLYAHTSVWFWPWLWWQLFRLELWIEQTGRDVMVAVDHCGNLYITRISADPNALRVWTPSAAPYRHQHTLSARFPGDSRDCAGPDQVAARPRPQSVFSDTRRAFVIPGFGQTNIRDPVWFNPR